jgi:hypothetical protein
MVHSLGATRQATPAAGHRLALAQVRFPQVCFLVALGVRLQALVVPSPSLFHCLVCPALFLVSVCLPLVCLLNLKDRQETIVCRTLRQMLQVLLCSMMRQQVHWATTLLILVIVLWQA